MIKKTLYKMDGFLYSFLDKYVDIMPMRFVKFIAFFYTDARVRKKYLRRLGVVLGENSYTNLGFRIVSNDYSEKVFIGKNVSIAVNAVLVCDSTSNNGKEINEILYVKNHMNKSDKIIIEDEVWIGANVTILPGIKIGKCAVVGAGSVVTKDVPEYTVVAGVPAKVIRNLKDER